MALIIQKFGGTSVGTLERIKHVASKIIQTRAQGHTVVAVASAMNGETDRLINLAKAIHDQPEPREYAALVATGEQVSIALITMALMAQGCLARSYTGLQAKIHTDNHHKKARILAIDCQPLREDLIKGYVPVVAGFQGIAENGDITTLGRGGSDTTAVALAAALQADECQIYTDVDGIYTADPRIVPEAQRLSDVTFDEMLELASQGAKVIQQRAVEFAGKYKVPLRVLSSFQEGPGTLINFAEKKMDQPIVTGIASNPNEARLTINHIPRRTDIAAEILATLATSHIDIDMLVQQGGISDTMLITFTVLRDDYPKALSVLQKIATEYKAASVTGDTKVAKISLVGIGLRSHPAIIGTLFKTLGTLGVHIHQVSASEIKVSVLINENNMEQSVCALHSAYGLDGVTIAEHHVI